MCSRLCDAASKHHEIVQFSNLWFIITLLIRIVRRSFIRKQPENRLKSNFKQYYKLHVQNWHFPRKLSPFRLNGQIGCWWRQSATPKSANAERAANEHPNYFLRWLKLQYGRLNNQHTEFFSRLKVRIFVDFVHPAHRNAFSRVNEHVWLWNFAHWIFHGQFARKRTRQYAGLATGSHGNHAHPQPQAQFSWFFGHPWKVVRTMFIKWPCNP